MRGVLLCCALLAACSSTSLKRAGESCTASSECASGLLCDLAMKPAVCADKGSLDAARPMVDGGADARRVDAKVDAAVDAPADAPTD